MKEGKKNRYTRRFKLETELKPLENEKLRYLKNNNEATVLVICSKPKSTTTAD